MASILAPNQSLEELTIEETSDPQKLWTDAGRAAFTDMLRNGTSIKHVKLDFERDSNTADKAFKSEVKFLTGMKAKNTARME